MKIKETELYTPIKRYLEGQGYTVYGEVRNCDMVAKKKEELIIIELKSSISLSLLIQAAERKEISDSVYIAVPVPEGKPSPPNFKRVKTLLRRLELGCILVDFLKTKAKIKIELHPVPFNPRAGHKKRRSILREIDGRYGEFNLGGETVCSEKITAYKQESLRIAYSLLQKGPSSPAYLRSIGCSEKTQPILSKNVYGWYERQKRGVYTLHPAGREALSNYKEVLELFDEIIE